MGLFSRKEAKSSRQTTQRPRPSVSSEAQAASLRVRARRRLAGAVALVLAAVIILPMLLEGDPRPVPAGIEIQIPERNAAFNPDLSVAPPIVAPPLAQELEPIDDSAVPTVDLSEQQATAAQAPETPETTQPPAQAAAPTPASPTTPTAPATAAPPSTAAPQQDSTELALAILEGRSQAAAPAASAAPGNLVVQVASYSTDKDAQARRDHLRTQGVSNAFVEPATVNGRQTFRLRVGPFDSRPAAEAAQARLRTLGYESGFITTK